MVNNQPINSRSLIFMVEIADFEILCYVEVHITMQIIADLDSSHYNKLITLQTQLNQDIQTLLQLAIDDLYERHQLHPSMTEGQKSLAILRKNGFIGCLQSDGNLSQDYKQLLDFGLESVPTGKKPLCALHTFRASLTEQSVSSVDLIRQLRDEGY